VGRRLTAGVPQRGLSREAVIADDGVVLTDDMERRSTSHNAAAVDIPGAPGRPPAEVFLGRRPGSRGLTRQVAIGDVDVAS
jgi:hypothetical protein